MNFKTNKSNFKKKAEHGGVKSVNPFGDFQHYNYEQYWFFLKISSSFPHLPIQERQDYRCSCWNLLRGKKKSKN